MGPGGLGGVGGGGDWGVLGGSGASGGLGFSRFGGGGGGGLLSRSLGTPKLRCLQEGNVENDKTTSAGHKMARKLKKLCCNAMGLGYGLAHGI